MPAIHEVATLTRKGQITLPKPIQQALGIEAGRNVRGLPEDLARSMLAQAGHGATLDEDIDGDVALGCNGMAGHCFFMNA